MPITVTAAQFPAAIRERLRQDTELVERIALEVAQRSLADAVRETNEAKAVDQGFYKLSWGARPMPRGAVLENTAPYAAVLEYGRRPGRPGPPLRPILEWVARKMSGTFRAEFRVARALALGAANYQMSQGGSASYMRAMRSERAKLRRMFSIKNMGGVVAATPDAPNPMGLALRRKRGGSGVTGAVGGRIYIVAKAIRDKIHTKGTKPRRILQKVAERMGPRFLDASVRELRRKR